jgi:adenylate cyclase
MSTAGLWQQLQQRKLVQWAVAYVAAAFALLQGADIVAAKFGWPDSLGRILIIVLCIGFFVTLLLAWYHGERGAQKVSGTELVLLALLLAIGGGLLWRFAPSVSPGPIAASTSAPRAKPVQDNASPVADEGKSVAVLPFENRSAGGEDATFLADGIQEDLINTLSRVPGLTVIARTAVLSFRDTSLPMAQIAARLGVSHLVEAGVQRAGDRVRINVQLFRAGDGQAEWSQRYDRTLSATNILDLQEEITEAVASTLQLKLGTKAGQRLLTGTTGNLAAYEAFLKGRKEWSDGSTPESIRLFKEALTLDPDYALAHGALAEAYVNLANEGLAPASEAYPLGQASALRALELDDHVVQAYTALAEYAFHYEWNWAESEKAILRALAIDPNYAIAYQRQSGHLDAWGRFDEAVAAQRRAHELAPEPNDIPGVGTFLNQRRYQEVLDLTAKYAAPDATDNLIERGMALIQTGHHEEGLQRLERAVQLHPERLSRKARLGWAYAQAGETAKAREIIVQLQKMAGSRFVSPLEVATVAAGLNDRELAFAQLDKAFASRDPNLPFIGENLEYDPIRSDPRFREMLRKLKLDVFFPEVVKK